MSTFAVIMFALTAFFAYQIYKHVQTLQDPIDVSHEDIPPAVHNEPIASTERLIEEADEAFGEGDLERALEKLAKADSLNPSNPEILNKLGFIEGKIGNSDKGIRYYQHSLEIDPNDDLAHNAIASLYKIENKFQKAQEHYEKALEIDPNYAVTYYNYGNLLVQKGEKEEAKELYLRALEIDPELSVARDALEEIK